LTCQGKRSESKYVRLQAGYVYMALFVIHFGWLFQPDIRGCQKKILNPYAACPDQQFLCYRELF